MGSTLLRISLWLPCGKEDTPVMLTQIDAVTPENVLSILSYS